MNTHLTVRAWTFSHSLALTSLCTSTCLTYCLLNRSKHLQFVNSHCATPMLCIIALLLFLTKSKSPCKSFSHLCEPFFPGHILFHWKVWGPSQGNHASVIGKYAIASHKLRSVGLPVAYHVLGLQREGWIGYNRQFCKCLSPSSFASWLEPQSSVAGNKFKLDLACTEVEQTN